MRKFILGDCMNEETGLPSYPDKFFDLAIVDPPYGIGQDGRKNHTRGGIKFGPKCAKVGSVIVAKDYRTGFKYDNEPPPMEYFKQLFRTTKNQIVFGANHFIDRMPYSSSCWLVWDKENGESDFADIELAWTSFKTAARKIKYKWNGMLQANMKFRELRIHPNQKPEPLYRWLLECYAKPGQLILDTHVGSASSLIACESMGFDYVGYEIDPISYSKSQNRMSKGIQGVLM